MKTKRTPKTKLPAPVHTVEIRLQKSVRTEREAFQKQHPDLFCTRSDFRETNGETFYTLEAWKKPEDYLSSRYPDLTLSQVLQQIDREMDNLDNPVRVPVDVIQRFKSHIASHKVKAERAADILKMYHAIRADNPPPEKKTWVQGQVVEEARRRKLGRGYELRTVKAITAREK